MERQKRFAVIGSDARQLAAGRALARAGYAVEGPEEIALADYILLPLPLDAARTPLAELLRAARPGALALGGMLSEEAKAIAAEAGVELVDYFAREELTIRNAIPTAEGCVGILLAQRKRTLWGSAVLLLGFGPVGQAVGTRLAALGAQVTVAARRPAQRAQAESLGMQGAELARLARLAAGLSDTPVTLAAKSLLRVGRPVVIAVSTNDGLGASGENIARLYQRKHYYFVPYGQDDPQAKPQSLKARFALLPAALDAALEGRQLQPVLCPAAGHGMSFQQGESVVY